jgi:S-adenosylmethionine synthetase
VNNPLKRKGEIIIEEIKFPQREYEFIERKGSGHPDTLSDELAEELSIAYSKYTLEKFGHILHHNFDKVGLLGGSSSVSFGKGFLVNPIRVLINGRASTKFGDFEIPLKEMLSKIAKDFLKKKFPMINQEKDIEIHYNISNKSSPGKTEIETKKEGTRKYWFEPRNKEDIKELKFLGSNDTSLGVGFAPLSKLGNAILNLSDYLASEKLRQINPWLGTDIKIMASKIKNEVSITLCIPQICSYVKDVQEYKNNVDKIKKEVKENLSKSLQEYNLDININTRDDYETGELYLTAIGSSIESGDEGLVGRGNRINGLICTTYPYTMEGACGKNPVYHIGKIYSLAAQKIAEKVSKIMNCYVEIFLVSQSGRLLIDPWKTVIGMNKKLNEEEKNNLTDLISRELEKIPNITGEILNKQHRLF